MIKHTLSSTTQLGLDELIAAYKQQYHPAGYGTAVDRRWEADGMYHAELSRYSSCD